MKFIQYNLNESQGTLQLNSKNSTLAFEVNSKEDALKQFDHHIYNIRPINGLNIGKKDSDSNPVEVFVPLNCLSLHIIQELYYFFVASIVTAIITLYIYSGLSIGDNPNYLNITWIYELYQYIINAFFSYLSITASQYNLFSNAFALSAPVFILIELIITMPIYLTLKHYLSFLPSNVLNLIFAKVFKENN